MSSDDLKLYESALEAMGGAVLLLDASLRVVAATPAAQRLLGARVPAGVHAVKLLCGDAIERPIAEVLASGKALVATVARLRSDGADRLVRVRAAPLRAHGKICGWVLQLAEDGSAGEEPMELHGLWTRDVTMKRVFHLAEKVASCDASVLIEGEMGTGKSSLAEVIHRMSLRHAGPFRTLSCASATRDAIEHQLGADDKREGTLFLDDVAELPHEVQAELLRVLETGVLTPLDGSPPKLAPVRVVAATHLPLHREVESGRFRADLFYRLGVVWLQLPPLRARHGDTALLVDKFTAELNARGGRHVDRIAPSAMERLEKHSWPGNVRELRVALESAFATGDGAVLLAADLPADVAEPFVSRDSVALGHNPSAPKLLTDATEIDEAKRIERALERAAGDRAQAASMLGMSRTTLWRRMRALGLLVLAPG